MRTVQGRKEGIDDARRAAALRGQGEGVRYHHQRTVAGTRAARQKGLTLEQATQRLAVRRSFPALRDTD